MVFSRMVIVPWKSDTIANLFSSKHCCSEVQPHRATSLAVDSCLYLPGTSIPTSLVYILLTEVNENYLYASISHQVVLVHFLLLSKSKYIICPVTNEASLQLMIMERKFQSISSVNWKKKSVWHLEMAVTITVHCFLMCNYYWNSGSHVTLLITMTNDNMAIANCEWHTCTSLKLENVGQVDVEL